KNLVGAFHQAGGVLIDPSVLGTLPARELTAGLCEAVKHGAISGRKLLGQTSDYVGNRTIKSFDRFGLPAIDLIANHVEFKAAIVAGDERESAGNTGRKSRKILNFGHTLGHALERLTDYKYFKHGEAVGYGVLFAAELSKNLEFLGQDEVKLLYDVVHRTGDLPPLPSVDPAKLFEAFSRDKKVMSGSLQWVLLEKIGSPVIVPDIAIPKKVLQKTVRDFFSGRSSKSSR
ncbi:MAG: hypothetical protein LC730_02520, partial [Acidobacteria bacterium]|nr:hypothetical protein [Acidobacteriota bacterium]